MKAPVLDCSERGPHEWMRRWQEGWKGERKRFQTNYPFFFSTLFLAFHTLYSNSLFSARLPLLCTFISVDWTIFILIGLLTKAFFGGKKRFKETCVPVHDLCFKFHCSVHKVDVVLWHEATWFPVHPQKFGKCNLFSPSFLKNIKNKLFLFQVI